MKPLAALAVAALAALAPQDLAKLRVERPLENAAADPAPAGRSSRVSPGLVAWHADVAGALAAARASGRPVLVFELLGRLDDELC